MGSDLRDAPAGKALKDPIGANLDRIPIIKGWLDAKSEMHEKVYNVVWGDTDKRKPDADGTLPPVGHTVDVDNAIWTNAIGDEDGALCCQPFTHRLDVLYGALDTRRHRGHRKRLAHHTGGLQHPPSLWRERLDAPQEQCRQPRWQTRHLRRGPLAQRPLPRPPRLNPAAARRRPRPARAPGPATPMLPRRVGTVRPPQRARRPAPAASPAGRGQR